MKLVTDKSKIYIYMQVIQSTMLHLRGKLDEDPDTHGRQEIEEQNTLLTKAEVQTKPNDQGSQEKKTKTGQKDKNQSIKKLNKVQQRQSTKINEEQEKPER